MTNIPTLTTQIITAYLAGPSDPDITIVPKLIEEVGTALARLQVVPTNGNARPIFRHGPDVHVTDQSRPRSETTTSIDPKKSVFPSYIVCLECGRKGPMLKRHLETAHELTPDEYRSKHRLTADYPMMAPEYAELRSVLAKASGLGKRRVAGKAGRKNGGRHG